MAYTFLKPGGGGIIEACPDIGTAFNYDDDPADELWIGWSAGPPSTLSYNRLILDDASHRFRAIGTFTSPVTPVFLGTAVFTPGGIPTNWSYGRGGFATYIISGGVRGLGPEQWCSTDVPAVQLKDFNHNGAMDALVAYSNGCVDSDNGVVAVLDNGAVQHLQQDLTRTQTWTARVVHADDDRIPDIRTENRTTGEVEYFIGVGDGRFVASPTANPDSVPVVDGKKVNVPVLANDYATSQARVTIVTPPRYGRAQVTSARTVVYTPDAHHGEVDRLVYRITEEGRQSTTSVYLRYRD
ncbi:MAG TPA: Ig-like domain-containing protein [Micromonospora sp.]